MAVPTEPRSRLVRVVNRLLCITSVMDCDVLDYPQISRQLEKFENFLLRFMKDTHTCMVLCTQPSCDGCIPKCGSVHHTDMQKKPTNRASRIDPEPYVTTGEDKWC